MNQHIRQRRARAGTVRRKPVLAAFLLLTLTLGLGMSAALAANTSPQGATLVLSAPDYWSGTAQTSGAGARLIAAGTTGVSPQQTAANGATFVPNPLALPEAEEGTVTVPTVTGLTQTEATTALANAGLSLGGVTQAFHATIAIGRVITQTPAAGTPVAPGSAVTLTVSKGPQPVTVPNVVNQMQADATTAITGAGLTAGAVTQAYHATIVAGRVISQNPAADDVVAPGTAVLLTVSKGPAPVEYVTVPSVVNQTQTAATATITGAGLTAGAVTQAYHATIPSGSVIAQNPTVGEQVAPGSAVALTLSKGPQPAEGEAEGEVEGEPPVEGELEGEPVTPPTAEEAKTQIAAAIASVDANGDGVVNYTEALAALPGLTQSVFNQLDTNGDGSLDKAELGVDDAGGCSCKKGYLTPDDLKRRLGDLFLMGLSLAALLVVSRIRR